MKVKSKCNQHFQQKHFSVPGETSSLNSRFWNPVLPSLAMLDHSLTLCHPTGTGLVGRSRENEDLSFLKPNERVETPPIRKEVPGESEN